MLSATAIRKALPSGIVHQLASSQATRVSLKQVYSLSRKVLDTKGGVQSSSPSPSLLLLPAQFLHAELPVRFSQSMALLEDPHLPKALAELPALKHTSSRFLEDLQSLTAFPTLESARDEERFSALLTQLRQRQRETLLEVGQGFLHLLKSRGPEANGSHRQRFLDAFYASQLGIRLLIGQHLALRQGSSLVLPLDPMEQARAAIDRARERCTARFGLAPSVSIISPLSSSSSSPPTIIHVVEHLGAILEAILNRAMAGTCKRSLGLQGAGKEAEARMRQRILQGQDSSLPSPDSLPPIELVLAEGNEDISVKVTDEGGGFSSRQGQKLWRYAWPEAEGEGVAGRLAPDSVRLPVDGECHGLPVARLTARYFGGDLNIVWMEGRGSVAYVNLPKDPAHLEEIPHFDRFLEQDDDSIAHPYQPSYEASLLRPSSLPKKPSSPSLSPSKSSTPLGSTRF
ncbi:MAG: mitochondrial branched-chain alpha-ketoacid dehydrogenase kinase-domain-containing protein [Piptocephalis tieghemiana]|nr:MAG: mitochondrial branched-chain alpha-ketoacid dehydrogenase kinase-domain-containing protein [Piptocephalis tieghemiana]